jgi:hypothetical protein
MIFLKIYEQAFILQTQQSEEKSLHHNKFAP